MAIARSHYSHRASLQAKARCDRCKVIEGVIAKNDRKKGWFELLQIYQGYEKCYQKTSQCLADDRRLKEPRVRLTRLTDRILSDLSQL